MKNIVQIGVPKSGNYWLYRILSAIVDESGLPTKSFIRTRPIYETAKRWKLSAPDQAEINVFDIEEDGCYYRISSLFRERVPDLDEYLEKNTLTWTHSLVCSRSRSVLSCYDKRVYIIRDPRDVAVSMSRFILTPYMRARFPSSCSDSKTYLRNALIRQVCQWREHVLGYMDLFSSIGAHFVFYERLVADFDSELRRLLLYLGLELSDEQLSTVKAACSFGTMKKTTPGHVRSGRSYGWMDALSEAQVEEVRRAYGDLLAAFGYPVLAGDERTLPLLPGGERLCKL